MSVDNLLSEARYTLRRLAATPGFALAAIATMALGIGANTAIFTLVNTVMLRPAAVDRPDRLVELYTLDSDGVPATSSYPDYRDYRDHQVWDGGAVAYQLTLLNRIQDGRSRIVFAEATSGNYFQVLGIRPVLGRAFTPADDAAGAPPTTILGYHYWQREFGARPDVLGQTVRLNGRAVTIVGVAPPSYKGGLVGFVVDLWIPLNIDYDFNAEPGRDRELRGNRSLFAKARLAQRVTLEEAQAAMLVVSARLAAAYPDTNPKRSLVLFASSDVRLHPNVDRYVAPIAALLMAVPGLVLLIACANVANLLLARAQGRTREIAVRLAIGASRARLIRLLLTESMILSSIGGAAGLLLAWWLLRLIEGWTPPGLPIPVALDLGMDSRVAIFTVLVSLATGLLFGLAPALKCTRPQLTPALKDESASILSLAPRRFGIRNALVVTQVGVSLVLLTAAGLFVRSLQRAQDIEPGFERARAIIVTPAVMLSDIPMAERQAFTETLRDRLAALPGVVNVALADRVPLGAQVRTTSVLIDDQQPDQNERGVDVDYTIVDAGYFRTLGIPLLGGRDFTPQDDRDSPRVAIVSEAFAKRYWPDVDPIGRLVHPPGAWQRRRPGPGGNEDPPYTVIGVARDTKVRTLGEAPRPYLYTAWRQSKARRYHLEEMALVLRTAGDPASLVDTVRQTVVELNPNVPILSLTTMTEHLSLMMTPPRLAAAFLGGAGALAILLASLGLYAVVAFTAARRTKEIGIRVALGATRAQVIRLVVSEGMTLVAVGVGLGFVLAAAATRPLGAYLYGLDAFDPITFVSVAAILAGTALVANYLPARRAVRVDPLKAIRYE